MSRCRSTAAVVALAPALASCLTFGGGSDPPEIVTEYLTALSGGRYAEAYDLTQLEGIGKSSPAGTALTLGHFEAFHRSSGLRGYDVEKVTKLTQLREGALNQKGSPYYVVDVRFDFADGSRRETLTVEGDILPTVQVEPDPVLIELPGSVTSALVDGIRTVVRPSRSDAPFSLLLLRGRHTLTFESFAPLVIDTFPLAVREGPAVIADGKVVVRPSDD